MKLIAIALVAVCSVAACGPELADEFVAYTSPADLPERHPETGCRLRAEDGGPPPELTDRHEAAVRDAAGTPFAERTVLGLRVLTYCGEMEGPAAWRVICVSPAARRCPSVVDVYFWGDEYIAVLQTDLPEGVSFLEWQAGARSAADLGPDGT